MKPLVTICLPVFNNAQYLHQTIESIREQTYENIEIVAVDDCSTDNSYEILRLYEAGNFKLHKNHVNLGVKANWNKCVELSSGKFIKMMGADDLLLPECIAKQVKVIESVNVDLVSSNRFIISDSGSVLLKLYYPFKGYVSFKQALRRLLGSGRNIIGEPVVCLMRKDALVAIGGFSALNNYVIDIDTWAKLINPKGLYAMEDFLSSFRISSYSISSKEGFKQIKSVFEFINSYQIFQLGFFTKFKAYFLAILFGILRNIVFRYSNRKK